MDSIKRQLITAYNRQADTRNAATKESWKITERGEFLHTIQAHHVHCLLEIGAGPGHDAKFFQNNGFEVTCIDLSPNMVTLCKEKGLNAHVMDFSQLTFPDDSFDAVWALNCLLHVPKSELQNVLAEIQRVLEPGGLFYMGVYGREYSEGIWEGDSYEPKRFFSFFDEETLKRTLSQFFTVVSFKILPHTDIMDFQSVVLMNHKESSLC